MRLLVLGLLAVLAVIFLGPMAPQGSFISDFAGSLRQALNVHWGMPFGLPTN